MARITANTLVRIFFALVSVYLFVFYLHNESNIFYSAGMQGTREAKRRSGCPVSISLERLGDRWSLLIIRDLMIRGAHTFKDFQQSGEGIASNILSDRLRNLESAGIITAAAEKRDGRKINYRLTKKGIDLAPVVFELLVWATRHEETEASCAVIDHMAKDREAVLAEVRRRWRARDLTPLQSKSGEWRWP
jgi:DNA-binding HxlR family transcriptional regulator